MSELQKKKKKRKEKERNNTKAGKHRDCDLKKVMVVDIRNKKCSRFQIPGKVILKTEAIRERISKMYLERVPIQLNFTSSIGDMLSDGTLS